MGRITSDAIPYDSLPDFLTHKELCQYLRIGHNRAYTLSQRIDFPKVPFGNRYVFPKQQVKEWMERQAETHRNPKALKALGK
ncbi:helix-turn-helix domain-containing protein [Desulfosporosinus sp. BG]|uniref:helix-turn-helix domain-containing protein n=1 Tax=Desulfosporosinus sp. BG TaxID=1633135 RepID=UPI00083B38F1|nr:helix-turn-helix domain-containing protein [Desulfosporosinus sp. BG]